MNDLARNLAFILMSLALLAGMLQAMRLLGRRAGLDAETRRKLIHAATGLYALSFPLLFSAAWAVIALMIAAIAMLAILRLPRFSQGGLSSALHGVSRASHGEIYLAIAIGLIFARSQHAPVLYVLPVMVITLSDAAAALVGVNYGRRTFMVEDGSKSWEGSAAFFVLTWLISMICLLLMTDIARQNVILTGFMAAMAATLVEAGSWKGLDNLFVPLALHVFLARYMTASPATLVIFATLFVFAALAVLFIGRRLGVNRHAGRGFVILLFLMASITSPVNVIPPVAAIIAHVAATRLRPAGDAHADFAMLAASAAVAIGWFFAGELAGRSAIGLFSMTFASAASALFALALGGWPRALAAAAIMAGYVLVLHTGAPGAFSWPVAAAGAVSIAASAAIAGAKPGLFDHARAWRVFALALAVPLMIFAYWEIST